MSILLLPVELIRQILEADLPPPPPSPSSKRDWQKYYDFLRISCCISKAWTNEAQAVLWKRIVVFTEGRIESLRVSQSAKIEDGHLTREFYLVLDRLRKKDPVEITRDTEEIVAALRGVQVLHLEARKDKIVWDLNTFCKPNLRELHTFTVNDTTFKEHDVAGQQTFPFTLKSLNLVHCGHNVLARPYTFFAQPSITQLTLDSTPDDDVHDEDYVQLFRTIAPHLYFLDLTILDLGGSDPDLAANLLAVIPSCTMLSCLTLDCTCDEMGTVLRTLPSRPSRLYVSVVDSQTTAQVSRFVIALSDALGLPSMSALEILGIMESNRLTLETTGGAALLRELEERHVSVVFDFRKPFW